MLLSQTVVFEDMLVKRSFDIGYESTTFGSALMAMRKSSEQFIPKIVKAFGEIHKQDTSNLIGILSEFFKNPSIYYRDQPVHWYWSEFYRTIVKKYTENPNVSFGIHIKACCDYYFYMLEGSVVGEPLEENLIRDKTKERELLHDPFFRRATPPGRKAEDFKEDIRGIADTLLFLAPALIRLQEQKDIVDLLRWFDLHLELTINNWDEDRQQLKFTVEPSIRHTKHISLPPDYSPVLVASPAVRDALGKLADVWLNPSATAVLLSAAPGSGKEVLLKFLVRALRWDPGQILEVSAAELGTFEALSKRLEQALSKNAQHNPSRLMLFLDEVHHDAALGLRSGLLRLMETGKLVVQNGGCPPCKSILYVFAASIPVPEVRMLPPPDLWTRIDHTVVQHHPLRLDNGGGNRKEVIMDYFFLFWMNRCRIKYLYPDSQLDLAQIKSSADLVCCEELVNRLSLRFADQIGSPLIPLISIRVLRNIIRRLRSRTAYYVRTHPRFTELDSLISSIEPEFDRWMFAIFNELVPDLIHGGMF